MVGPVDWAVGDQIVIASTEVYNPQNISSEPNPYNEVKQITAISGNLITLNSALAFTHLGETKDYSYGGLLLHRQAEVGLISGRNIIIQGGE